MGRILIVLVMAAAVGGVLIWLSVALRTRRDPQVLDAVTMRTLARDAAEAAKRGDYAERDRLDYVLTNLVRQHNPRARPFAGSKHDDWAGTYMADGTPPGDEGR